jgi:hypothetical protein
VKHFINTLNERMEGDLDDLHELVKQLRTLKQMGKLRKRMAEANVEFLAPIDRNKTRWGSTYAMCDRYLIIEPYLDKSDPDLAPFLLTVPRDLL